MRAVDGAWLPFEFLLDVGADRTVFSAAVLAALGLPQLPAAQQLGGVGGTAATVVVGTHLRLALDGGSTVAFQGSFAAFLQAEALDMSVLRRDIMNLFAVIVDYPARVVCLVGQGHGYAIMKQP